MHEEKKKKSPKNVNLEEYINFSFFMLSYTFLLLLFFHVLMDGFFFLFYFFKDSPSAASTLFYKVLPLI